MYANASLKANESAFSPIPSLDNILFIDQMPLLAFAFQELARGINPAANVQYEESYISVVSRPCRNEFGRGLIVLGSDADDPSVDLHVPIYELRKRFPEARMMVYSAAYDPAIIRMVENSTLDACLHTSEPVEEIRCAYRCLLRGDNFISPMLRTLYYDYKLMEDKIKPCGYQVNGNF